MGIKANAAYDRAGFETTKSLVTSVREFLGKSVPESLRGEPSSLRADAIRPDSSVAKRRTVGAHKKK